MKLIDVYIETDNIEVGNTYKALFYEGDKTHVKMLEIVEYCGKGGYGVVYKCIYAHNKICALKLSLNEIPSMLKKRYENLINDLGKDMMVKIRLSGEIRNNNLQYKYYSIMEYGGVNLKKYVNKGLSSDDMYDVVKQLVAMCKKIYETKHLITDFKLSNLTINEQGIIKMIDIYMEASNYETYENCRYFKTLNILNINICKLYKSKTYDFSYIYTLLAFILIDLICLSNMNKLYEKLKTEENDKKAFAVLVQLSFYLKNNKKDEKIDKYIKKNTELRLITNLYERFMEEIKIRNKYENIITTRLFKKFLDVIIFPTKSDIDIYKYFHE